MVENNNNNEASGILSNSNNDQQTAQTLQPQLLEVQQEVPKQRKQRKAPKPRQPPQPQPLEVQREVPLPHQQQPDVDQILQFLQTLAVQQTNFANKQEKQQEEFSKNLYLWFKILVAFNVVAFLLGLYFIEHCSALNPERKTDSECTLYNAVAKPCRAKFETNIVFIEGEKMPATVPQWITNELRRQLNDDSVEVTVTSNPWRSGSVVIYLKSAYARINQDITAEDDQAIRKLAAESCLVHIVVVQTADFAKSFIYGKYEKVFHENLENEVIVLQKPFTSDGNVDFDKHSQNKDAVTRLISYINKHQCVHNK